MCERSGRPDVTSWGKTRESQPGFSHEETQHVGTAQSVVTEVIPRERPERPDVDPQRGARPQQFIIGNDVNRIRIVSGIKIIREPGKWSSAKKTETTFKCYRRWRETFYELVNVRDCNNGIRSIHGKELPEQLPINCEHNRSHTEANVRHFRKIGGRKRWDLWIGNNWLGKSFMEIPVINWRRKSHQPSAHKGLRLFRCCIVSWKDPSKSRIQRCLEENDRMDHIFSKLQRLWRNQWRADWIRVEHLPGFDTLQLHGKVKDLLSRSGQTTRKFHRNNSIFVDVQRHFLWIKRQWKRMPGECLTRFSVCKEKRTMVIHWSWFWKEVVLYQWRQPTRSMGQYCRKNVGWIRRKRTPNFPCYEPIVPRSTQKQRTWKIVDTLCSRFGNG